MDVLRDQRAVLLEPCAGGVPRRSQEAAKEEFQLALRLAPEEPMVYSWYAAFYLSPMGLIEETLEADQKAVELDPKRTATWDAWNRVALFHYRSRNWKDAEVEARSVACRQISVNPR